MKRKLAVVILSALGLLALQISVADEHSRAYQLRKQGQIMPLEEILNQARRHPDERIIEVELEDEDGLLVYELEFIGPDGYVRKRLYDARTGELIKEELEDD